MVGYTLLDHLPDDWTSADLHVTAAANTARTWVEVETGHADQPGEEEFALPDIAEACLALRRSMYEPAKGTWYAARIRLDHRSPHVGQLTTSFNYHARPFTYWGPEEIELVRHDQDLYPRSSEDLPDWHPAR